MPWTFDSDSDSDGGWSNKHVHSVKTRNREDNMSSLALEKRKMNKKMRPELEPKRLTRASLFGAVYSTSKKWIKNERNFDKFCQNKEDIKKRYNIYQYWYIMEKLMNDERKTVCVHAAENNLKLKLKMFDDESITEEEATLGCNISMNYRRLFTNLRPESCLQSPHRYKSINFKRRSKLESRLNIV